MERRNPDVFLDIKKEKLEISKEQAQAKIEALKQEIEELSKAKEDLLARIEQDTQEQAEMTVSQRREKEATSFIDFESEQEVRQIDFIKTKKSFYLAGQDEKGQAYEITPAEMTTDLDWGIHYELNHQVVSKDLYQKYNEIRSQYAATYYDKSIRHKHDQLLIYQRLFIDKIKEHDVFLSQAYESLLEGKDERKAGFVFEKMIQGTLERISLDLGDEFGIEYLEADVVDDVEFKTDCILKIEDKHHRAAGVEEVASDSKRKGIQLTLKKSGDRDFDDKKRQIENVKKKLHQQGLSSEMPPIDDLVLLSVNVGNREIMSKYDQWQKDHQPAGGPEKLFKPQRLMEILSGVFEDSVLDFNQNDEFKKALEKYLQQQSYGRD